MPHVMPQLQSQPEALPGEFYDHENDADLELGGRRRSVADWGADDLFDRIEHSPRRRRSAKSLAARDRRISGPMSGAATITRIEDAPSYPAGDAPVAPAEAHAAVAEAGRRTVTVTGRPQPLPARKPERRRPPRTVEERIGHRPDRVAAWAVGLGMLLILIAVGTADAAPL
jgi:hypothetical protein